MAGVGASRFRMVRQGQVKSYNNGEQKVQSIKRKWWCYHKRNPEVYELFKRYTFQLIRAGHNHYSAKGVFERIRWHSDVETAGEPFKISNNYTPYYARLFMTEFKRHDGFFRIKELKDN